jgi:hypothetical protein
MWERRRAYRGLVYRLEEKEPLGRPRPRWEESINMSIQ